MNALPRLWQAWLATLQTIARDKGVVLILGLAPLIYGFFTPGLMAPRS